MRIVAKVGTSSLTDNSGVIQRDVIASLCDQMASLRQLGHEVVLVSSAAISAGVAALAMPSRPTDVLTLQALAAAGAQVLDLEALANHRSSVLGSIPGQSQPSQKRFDTLVWAALRGFDTTRAVYIESESKKVGNLAVPDSLITAMRASPCLLLTLPENERVKLLLEDYDFFVRQPEQFCQRLDALVALRGKAVVEQWKKQVTAGDFDSVVRELLTQHYDPGYLQSIKRNFAQYGAAKTIAARAGNASVMAELALNIIAKEAG